MGGSSFSGDPSQGHRLETLAESTEALGTRALGVRRGYHSDPSPETAGPQAQARHTQGLGFVLWPRGSPRGPPPRRDTSDTPAAVQDRLLGHSSVPLKRSRRVGSTSGV